MMKRNEIETKEKRKRNERETKEKQKRNERETGEKRERNERETKESFKFFNLQIVNSTLITIVDIKLSKKN